ncbi:MAG: 50S ribosomal protein L10 [Actinomycetota bacterium]
MPNTQKVEKVKGLKAQIEGAEALLLAEYRGLSVHDTTEVRRSLSDLARFSVVKNTLFQRAAADAGLELEALLAGPTAVAFVDGDVVAVAKKIVDAAKRFPSLVLKGAYMEGKVLSAAEAQALASLDSRDVMLSKLAGLMKTEMTRAASMFQALQGRFLGVLDAYKDKLQPAQPEPAVAVEAEAEAPSGASSTVETELSTDVVVDGPPEETAAEARTPEPEEASEAEASPGDEEE